MTCTRFSPADPDRTVLILNANPNADALHPDAIYRLAVDNDGDLFNNIAFSLCSRTRGRAPDRRCLHGYRRGGRVARSGGEKIFYAVEVSFGPQPNVVTVRRHTFVAGARSDAFFFDFDGIKNLFDTSGGRNFTEPHLGGKSPGRAWIPI